MKATFIQHSPIYCWRCGTLLTVKDAIACYDDQTGKPILHTVRVCAKCDGV